MFQDWHPLGAILYRKWQVYDMAWDSKIKLENFIVCGAPFGGPIAMMLDAKRSGHLPEMETFINKLFIKTSSGNHIATIDWDDKAIIGMGWSDQEHLVTVLENGAVKLFDIHGKLLNHFSLLDAYSSGNAILECHFWGNGVAVINSDMIIYVAEVCFCLVRVCY